MTSVQRLLRFAVEQGASDLHISSGDSPMLRMSGDLVRVDLPPLTPEEAHRAIFDVMSDPQRRRQTMTLPAQRPEAGSGSSKASGALPATPLDRPKR